MRLTPLRVIGLLAVAAILAATAILDMAASAPSASCASAKSSLNEGLTSQAESAYLKLLAKEPTSPCAKEGVKKVGDAWCERGKRLMDGRATLEAVKAYTQALNEPPTPQPLSCALKGLAEVNAGVATAHPPDTLKAACNVTMVNVYGVNGKNGLNGQNGLNGLNGKNGENGKHGASGAPGKPGAPGRPGRGGLNGHNGHNGHNGRNGLNGKNGKNGLNVMDGDP
jgi:hypothetical protein